MNDGRRHPPAPPGPTALAERTLAPDLARGFMLLFIALANSYFFLVGADLITTTADRIAVLVQYPLVHGRAIPLFALLFGYGMGRLVSRLEERGTIGAAARRIMRRRGWALLVLGFLHGALLLPVDILGVYGLTALLLAGLLRVPDRMLLRPAALLFCFTMALVAVVSVLSPENALAKELPASLTEPDFAAAVAERTMEWITYIPTTALLVTPSLVLLGIWAARHRILDEPERHLPLLRWTAAIALGVAVLGGLPLALMETGIWADAPASALFAAAVLHGVTSLAGGPGWAALLALFATALASRRNPVIFAVEAVGQQSLSCYLLMSVVFTAVFAPSGAGLGATLGAAPTAAIAVATWVGMLILATVVRRSGKRGAAETVLRRFTYGGAARTGTAGAASRK